MEPAAALGAGARERLEARHDAREAALRASRAAIRASANAIRAAHRGDRDAATALLAEARRQLDGAVDVSADEPSIRHGGFLTDAEKEYAEARTTFAVLADEPLPSADDCSVDVASWLNGIAETVGEIRRHLLDQLRHGRIERCEALLGVMEDIYGLLVTIDLPEGVTGGLRRSTDVARSILERTRGDLTVALLQDRLRDALDRHQSAVVGDR